MKFHCWIKISQKFRDDVSYSFFQLKSFLINKNFLQQHISYTANIKLRISLTKSKQLN